MIKTTGKINRKEVIQINGLYISQLWRDWYAADYIVRVKGVMYRVRSPYRTPAGACQMLDYLAGKTDVYKLPEYTPMVQIIGGENQR